MKNELTKKIFNIGLAAYQRAKKVYKNGAFVYASDSVFLRAVMDDILEKANKR